MNGRKKNRKREKLRNKKREREIDRKRETAIPFSTCCSVTYTNNNVTAESMMVNFVTNFSPPTNAQFGSSLLFSFWLRTWPLPTTPSNSGVITSASWNKNLRKPMVKMMAGPVFSIYRYIWEKVLRIPVPWFVQWCFCHLPVKPVLPLGKKSKPPFPLIGYSRIYSVEICTVVFDIFPTMG